MYGIKLNKDDGDDHAAVLPVPTEDASEGPEINGGCSVLDDHDGQDARGAASEDSYDHDQITRSVQVLAIRANFFPIEAINSYDWVTGRCIYTRHEGEVQEVYTYIYYLPYVYIKLALSRADSFQKKKNLMLYLLYASCFVHTDVHCK